MNKKDIYNDSIYRASDQELLFSFIRPHTSKTIIILGDAGSGKTFLAESLLEKFLDNSYTYRFKFSPDNSTSIFIESLIIDLVSKYVIPNNLNKEDLIRQLIYLLDLNTEYAEILENIIIANSCNYNIGILYSLLQKILDNIQGRKIILLDDSHLIIASLNNFLSNINIPINTFFILTSRIPLRLNFNHTDIKHIYTSPLTEKNVKEIVNKQLAELRKKSKIVALIIEKCNGNIFYLNFLISEIRKKKFKSNIEIERFIRQSALSIDFLYGTVKISHNQKKLLEILALESPLSIEIIKEMVGPKLLKNDINFLLRTGLVKGSYSALSLPHDIFGEQLQAQMPAKRMSSFRLNLAQAFIRSNLNRTSRFEKASFHLYEAQSWIWAYKYNLSAANLSMKQHRPNEAISFIQKAEESCANLHLLKTKRAINLSIQKCKAYFLLGVTDAMIFDIKLLEQAYLNKNISKKTKNEIINLLSLYYWNNGQLKKGYEILRNFEISGEIEKRNIPLFKFRQTGILSDMGEFNLSNTIAKNYLEQNSIEGVHEILGIPYSIKAAIFALIARNFAYLGDIINSEKFSNGVVQLLPDDHSLANIFSLCFLADSYIILHNIPFAKKFTISAIEKAKKYNLTALNSFLFSLLGYVEVMEGKSRSILKIEMAIKTAESEKRFGRLPRYYLLLIKAKRTVNPKTPLKRLANRALKIADRNHEKWVASEIRKYYPDLHLPDLFVAHEQASKTDTWFLP